MKQYTIKPLEWRSVGRANHMASTILGTLTIVVMASDECRLYHGDKYIDDYQSLEAAKAAAEKWYVEQIEQALTEVTD